MSDTSSGSDSEKLTKLLRRLLLKEGETEILDKGVKIASNAASKALKRALEEVGQQEAADNLPLTGIVTLWEHLTKPYEITPFDQTAPLQSTQTLPTQPKSADIVELWTGLPDDAKEWIHQYKDILSSTFMVEEAAKEEAELLPVDEADLYLRLWSQLFALVNTLLRAIQSPMRLARTRGAKSFIDFVGINLAKNREVKFGLEIKPETQDYSSGYADLAQLLNSEYADDFNKERKPCAQVLGDMVAEGIQYAGLLSNRCFAGFRRSENQSEKLLWISATIFNDCQDPSLPVILAYLLEKGRTSPYLDPADWPQTERGEQWVYECSRASRRARRGHEEIGADEKSDDEDGDKDGDGDEDDKDDDDDPEKDGNKGNKKRARRGDYPFRGSQNTGDAEQNLAKDQLTTRWLQSLPTMPFAKLHLGKTISKSQTALVRVGEWQGRRAVFKMFSAKNPAGRAEFVTEVDTYMALKSIQGQYCPHLLAVGSTLGTMWVICLSYCGQPLAGGVSNQDAAAMRVCLHELHRQNVLHCDLRVENFVKGAKGVFLVDFASSRFASQDILNLEARNFDLLLRRVTNYAE